MKDLSCESQPMITTFSQIEDVPRGNSVSYEASQNEEEICKEKYATCQIEMVSDNVIVEGFDESEVLRQLLGQGTILEQSGAALQTEHEAFQNTDSEHFEDSN